MRDPLALSILQRSLIRWDWLEYGSAALVLLGVVGESLLELTRVGEGYAHRKRLVVASALLLIIGLAFELSCAVMISSTAGQITAFLNKEAGVAIQQAGDANASAAGAQKQTALLGIEAINARTRERSVEVQLERQRATTASAEKDLAELREAVRPRHITHEQQASLIPLLSVGPKGPVDVVCVIGDAESQGFANQIDNLLASAGWNVGQFTFKLFPGSGPVGVGIVVRSRATAPAYAVHIQQAFFSVGIPLSGVEDPNMPEGSVKILVGHKPNPN